MAGSEVIQSNHALVEPEHLEEFGADEASYAGDGPGPWRVTQGGLYLFVARHDV